MIISIVSLCISLFTLSLTVLRDFNNIRKDKSNAVIAYLNEGDSEHMKNRRRQLYTYEKELKNPNGSYQKRIKQYFKDGKKIDQNLIDLETCITQIVSFYDKWALLYNKKYLPKWSFQGPRATTFLKICDIIMFYIDFRRTDMNHENYANDLLKLYSTLITH